MNAMQFEKVGTLRESDVFEWKIPGYVLKNKYSTKRSDLFDYHHLPQFKFCLTLRSFPSTFDNLMSFSVQLHRISVFNCGSEDPDTSKNSERNVTEKWDVRFILYKTNSVHSWTSSMTLEGDRLTANFPIVSSYDSLTVQCIMMPPDDHQIVSNPSQSSSNVSEVSHSLADGMAALLSTGNLTDVTLSVEDKEFKVHRCILSSRSEVFAAMFKHDTLEKRKSKIVIIDFPSEIIGQTLKYVYTDQIDELTPDQLLLLFRAADKYALLDLRKKCSRMLKRNLSLDLVLDVLLAADLHQDNDLKEAALLMFLKSAVSVMSSEQWLPFMKSHAELTCDILIRLAKKSSGIPSS